MPQVLQVPVVYHEIRQQEAYYQMFDALEQLDSIVEEVFSKVTSRVTKERTRLSSLDRRLNVAQSKVKQIAGTTKATTILSPAKYPAPEKLTPYTPIYENVPRKPFKHPPYKLQDVPHVSSDFYRSPLTDDILPPEGRERDIDVSAEGLGRLPRHLLSVSSLLLFNSQENPYKKYVSLDNLAGKESAKKERDVPKKELSAAPKTFIEGDTLPAVAVIEYNYRPKLGEVPELNLPSVLPNLPNVADITWSVGTLASIAPSTEIVPTELPAVENIPPPTRNITPAVDTSILPVASEPISSSSAPAPPPPPPPAPAPPPPPPAPTPPSAPPPIVDELPSADSGRAGLLADIRKGKALKPANKRKLSQKAPSKKVEDSSSRAAPPPSGDIFSDLILALNRRRAGIAEKQSESAARHAAEDEKIIAPPTKDGDWDV